MRGKLQELWHRHLGRKPWVFRDQAGCAYLFAPEDPVAEYCEQGDMVRNPGLLAYVQENVQPGQTFVDLSPDIGGLILSAAVRLNGTGAVFAFAPDAKQYRQLVNNVALNTLAGTVRIIGRNALASPSTASSITLDQFAANWQWQQVDHVRLRDVALLGNLQASAAGLFRARRIRSLLLEKVDQAALATVSAALAALGFRVQLLSSSGQLQPLDPAAVAGKVNLVAHLAEAGHA